MKCCGQDRDTPYCPECGSVLKDENSLAGLLRYLSTQERAAADRLARIKKRLEEGPTEYCSIRHLERRVRAVMSSFAKWSRWREAVEGTLKSRDQS